MKISNVGVGAAIKTLTNKDYSKKNKTFNMSNMDRIIRDPTAVHSHISGSECEYEEQVAGYDSDGDKEKGEPQHQKLGLDMD